MVFMPAMVYSFFSRMLIFFFSCRGLGGGVQLLWFLWQPWYTVFSPACYIFFFSCRGGERGLWFLWQQAVSAPPPPPRTGQGGGEVRSSSREPRPLTGGREGERGEGGREREGRAGGRERGMGGRGEVW